MSNQKAFTRFYGKDLEICQPTKAKFIILYICVCVVNHQHVGLLLLNTIIGKYCDHMPQYGTAIACLRHNAK